MVFFIPKNKIIKIIAIFLLLLIASGCMLQVERYFKGVKKGVVLENYDLSYYLESEVEAVVTQLALEKNIFPMDAGINKKTGQITNARYGKKVKIAETVYDVMHAQPDTRIYLHMEKIPPAFDENVFADLKRISSYVTWFYGKDGRYENIKLALRAINNSVVYPNEIFSFNKVVGPRSAKRGFKKAPSIGIPEDYGGGVCQVASTLYNAALKSELTLVERHKHSKPVQYVPRGKDATVYYGYADLKFLNNKPYPIIIKTSFRSYGVRVYILGGGVK